MFTPEHLFVFTIVCMGIALAVAVGRMQYWKNESEGWKSVVSLLTETYNEQIVKIKTGARVEEALRRTIENRDQQIEILKKQESSWEKVADSLVKQLQQSYTRRQVAQLIYDFVGFRKKSILSEIEDWISIRHSSFDPRHSKK